VQVVPQFMQVVRNHKLLGRLLAILADQVELEMSLHDATADGQAAESCKLSMASKLLNSCDFYRPLALYRQVRFYRGLTGVHCCACR
jgi:hypothetical protein